MKVVSAESDQMGLIRVQFDDGTEWATYPDSPNEAHNYLHELLVEFIAAGGTVTEA